MYLTKKFNRLKALSSREKPIHCLATRSLDWAAGEEDVEYGDPGDLNKMPAS